MATYGAAAALHTTTSDYAKFMLELLNRRPADAFQLTEKNWNDYLSPLIKRDEITSRSLGWLVGQLQGMTWFTHAGSAPGWNCEAAASLGRKTGMIINDQRR
jgi:hypothetical protein